MDKVKINERNRTNNFYNLNLLNYVDFEKGVYQMPLIHKEEHVPTDLVGFNYHKSDKYYAYGLHFYLDDYQFERLWNKPDAYYSDISKFDCMLSPDFSLYLDMPESIKIWNTYRSRLIGAYYQSLGIKVIPALSWADEKSFDYCFKGVEQGGTISISTIGVKQHKESLKVWHKGVDEMIKQVNPKTVVVYGGKIEHDYQNIEVIYIENKTIERLNKLKKR